MQRSVGLIIALGLLTGVVLAQVQPSAVVGDIVTGGSPAAGTLVTRIADRFRAEGYQGNLLVDSVGTTTGFAQFCSGQQDIVNADRLVTEQEQSACTATGRTATAFRIASDAMVVAVSPQNTFVNSLSTAELVQLFSTALNWSDVRPEWPAAPIQRYTPSSGTEDFNYLVDALYGGNSQPFATAIGTKANSDYTLALTNIQNDPNAVGFFPAGFAAQNSTALRVIPINGVAPDASNISLGTYPLIRPIYLYSDLTLMAQQPQVGSFIRYALDISGEILVNAGLFPASPTDLAQAKQLAAQGSIQTTVPAATSPTSAAPAEPLSAVYCASTSDNLTLNGQAVPSAGGCTCVRVYGPHQLTSQPDLYTGFDVNQIQTLSQSTTQCLGGVTTYDWTPVSGFANPVLTPNINNLPSPTPVPDATSPAQATLNQTLTNLRADLDQLAFAVSSTRPDGWSGSSDLTNANLPLLIRLDLEYLASAAIGDQRPVGWFGSVPSTPDALVRDIRHDLELLADAYIGQNNRPENWIGDNNPLVRCDRPTQTLISLLQRGGVFTLTTAGTDPQFCLLAMLEATTFSERTLLSNPVDQPIFSSAVRASSLGANTIDTDFAVAFLDRSAVLSVGLMPKETPITPVARSTAEFSRMTLIQGDGFLAFVDYRDTTLTEEEFQTLPNADEYPTEPFCSADWCGK